MENLRACRLCRTRVSECSVRFPTLLSCLVPFGRRSLDTPSHHVLQQGVNRDCVTALRVAADLRRHFPANRYTRQRTRRHSGPCGASRDDLRVPIDWHPRDGSSHTLRYLRPPSPQKWSILSFALEWIQTLGFIIGPQYKWSAFGDAWQNDIWQFVETYL